MMKFAALAAVLTVSALAAAPASAAGLTVSSPNDPIVRISVAGKSADVLNAEIKAAANAVCTDAAGLNAGCAADAYADATEQLAALTATHHTSGAANVQVAREGPSTVRVSLKDKSVAQVASEIDAAAHTVCKSVSDGPGDFDACVAAATSDAKYQLRAIVAQSGGQQMASY